MKAQKRNKRNLSQEFETILNGRSILDLTGEEVTNSIDLLTEITKSKPLKSLTKTELQALIEALTEIIAINMFKDNIPSDWKKEMIENIRNCSEREWEFSFSSILDFYLHHVEIWYTLDAEEREIVAKTILKYLEGENYYDYLMGYVEDYLDEEEN